MARKKGGKKGKSSQASKESIPQSEPEQVQGDSTSPVPVGETVEAEELQEPVLADAVSEVLGDNKKGLKNNKATKKYKTQLAKYSADGFDVSGLEKALESDSSSDIKDAFKKFEDGISVIEKVKNELLEMNLAGLDQDVEALNSLLLNPLAHEAITKNFESLKFKGRSAEISAALQKMVLPIMKSRVEALKAMLQNPDDREAIELEFSNLKRDYKEAYAEEGVKAQIVTSEPEAKAEPTKAKVPMIVKDIFLLYKDGRFISHHTNRVVSKEQQKELFADLKTGRNFLRSPKYVPQKLNVIPIENRHILVQSGRFTVVIMITEGTVDPWSERIITKVLTLMEKEDQVQLNSWNGDVSSLKSSGKYMQALLFACMKLANKGKA